MSNNVETVKSLLNNGVDVNAKNHLGTTALMSAASSGQTNMVEFLLDRGADINAKDIGGDTALTYSGQPQIDPTTGLPKTFTSDDEIIEVKICKLLLDKGADINAKDSEGMTALMYAASSGQTNMVEFFLDKGADINAKDKAGHTALGNAIENGNAAIVQLLQPVNAVVASGTNTDSSGYVTNEALLTPFTLTNSVGDVITNAVLVKLTANKFVYKTDAGAMGMLPLASLPEDLQEKFGYDSRIAQAADEADQQNKARQQQLAQRQREFADQQASMKAQSQSAVSDVSLSIREYAEKKWPNDYDMQKYEIEKQVKAYVELH